jgi:cytochrome c553
MNNSFKPYITAFCLISLVSGCGMSENTVRAGAGNGETIFVTGKNIQGVVLQDIAASQMKMLHGCVDCHGSSGKGNRNNPSITYADLSSPALHSVPYTDALLRRFLNFEQKSDGSHADTGVVWRMSEQDQTDLIFYLQTL